MIVIGCIIVLIILIIYYYLIKFYLVGAWQGDTEFLADAELKTMTLFVAPGGSTGYLLVVDNDGKQIYNEPIEISVWPIMMKADVDIWPSTVMWTVNMYNGTLTIRDRKQIYAKLFKDFDSTKNALDVYNSE